MKLYYYPGACSLASHILLEWLGEPYQLVRMSLQTIKQPDYLALNPSGTVPLLIDDEFELTETVAILSYLADLHPEAGLVGDGTARGRAEVLRWLAFLNSDLHKAFKPIFTPQRYLRDDTCKEELQQTARVHVRGLLERIDARLADQEWLAGARSLADPYLFVMWRWTKGTRVDVAGLDNLQRFAARMYADPGVQTAVEQEEPHAAT